MTTIIQINTILMNFEELLEELDDRISAAKTTGFWDTDAKKKWINQAGQRVCDFAPWEFLKKAVYIQTTGDREYYDYPDHDNFDFKLNSIYNIVIEDEDYNNRDGRTRKKWDVFQKHKNQNLREKIFTNHNRYYFLHPIPENDKKMTIYGIQRWKPLTDNTDEPLTPSDLDEAIVRVALATCLRKARRHDEARAELAEVIGEGGILSRLFNQQQNEGPRGYGGKIKNVRFQ